MTWRELERANHLLELREPRGIVLAQVVIALDEAPPQLELVRQRLLVVAGEDPFAARNQVECRVRIGLQRDLGESFLDRARQ